MTTIWSGCSPFLCTSPVSCVSSAAVLNKIGLAATMSSTTDDLEISLERNWRCDDRLYSQFVPHIIRYKYHARGAAHFLPSLLPR